MDNLLQTQPLLSKDRALAAAFGRLAYIRLANKSDSALKLSEGVESEEVEQKKVGEMIKIAQKTCKLRLAMYKFCIAGQASDVQGFFNGFGALSMQEQEARQKFAKNNDLQAQFAKEIFDRDRLSSQDALSLHGVFLAFFDQKKLQKHNVPNKNEGLILIHAIASQYNFAKKFLDCFQDAKIDIVALGRLEGFPNFATAAQQTNARRRHFNSRG